MLFSEDFFQQETRCDFEITKMMKRAWAVQMEVLSLVADICEENGLQYFAEGGTLLGTVRHQGFIPWDDDIDIGLRREDYNELIRILPEKLPHGFKLGGIHAIPKSQDDVFPGFHSRVGTDSAVWGLKEHLDRFYGFPYAGVGIDIFVYDYLPRDKEWGELQVAILEYGKSLLGHWGEFQEGGDELEWRLRELEELCGADISREGNIRWNLQKRMDSVAGLLKKEESDEMSDIISTSILERGRMIRVRKECLEKVMYMPFETMEIAVPVGWHELLVATFGENYMTFERGTAGHEYPFWLKEEEKLLNVISRSGLECNVEEFCEKVLAGEINLQII